MVQQKELVINRTERFWDLEENIIMMSSQLYVLFFVFLKEMLYHGTTSQLHIPYPILILPNYQ